MSETKRTFKEKQIAYWDAQLDDDEWTEADEMWERWSFAAGMRICTDGCGKRFWGNQWFQFYRNCNICLPTDGDDA